MQGDYGRCSKCQAIIGADKSNPTRMPPLAPRVLVIPSRPRLSLASVITPDPSLPSPAKVRVEGCLFMGGHAPLISFHPPKSHPSDISVQTATLTLLRSCSAGDTMTLTEKKRRRRTGCLTCRTRRVKCDEGKPTCERCNAANIECVGYEEKRHVETRRPPRSSTAKTLPDDQVDSSATTNSPYSENLSSPHLRSDGLPLVALPSNPLPIQRPHTRARDILAYHQFLFRTLPLLFRPDELPFWRDRICQEAWENEFLYDTIMAVGGAHRAILMMSSMNEIDREGGVDNKVTAVQAYTKTLQGLSAHLDDAGRSPELFVGTLLLLTWFEVCT